MDEKKTFVDELDVLYDFDRNVAFYGMKRIVVDDIPCVWFPDGSQIFTVYKNPMIDLKDDVDDKSTERRPYFSGPYEYEHDGYPIDEETYLRRGWVISTNPINDWEREEALREG